jgi:short-subunit dehydrogenase
VNNAGFGLLGILEEAGSKYLRRQFDTNVFGLMDVTNATLPYLRKAKEGCVVVFLRGELKSLVSEIMQLRKPPSMLSQKH